MTAATASGVQVNLLALFQSLGIARAHIAAGGAPVLTDWHGLVIHQADRRQRASIAPKSNRNRWLESNRHWQPIPLGGRRDARIIEWPDYDAKRLPEMNKVINEPDFLPVHFVRVLC